MDTIVIIGAVLLVIGLLVFSMFIPGKTDKPFIATYKIEVGSTNELNEYEWSGTYSNYLMLKAYNITWSGEDINEKIGFLNVVVKGSDW